MDLSSHKHLFTLAFVSNPNSLLEQCRQNRLSDPFTCEMAAWCAELDAQLQDLGRDLGIPLVLMGGNGAALRLHVSRQRGSRDNDYLTTATEDDLDRLMHALASRFADFEAPMFRARRIEARGREALPLRSYIVEVPALIVKTTSAGRLAIKIEFHLEQELPPSEDVSGELFAVAEPVTGYLPKLPYQIGLKLITLAAAPVGIEEPAREDAIPAQLYDLDNLLRGMAVRSDWEALRLYTRTRYEKEMEQRGVRAAASEPWSSIDERLDRWAPCDENADLWRVIRGFQESQVARTAQRASPDWRTRIRRLQFAARCASVGPAGESLWSQARELEERIPERLQGRALRELRSALADLSARQRRFPHPQGELWEYLGVSVDPALALEQVKAILPSERS